MAKCSCIAEGGFNLKVSWSDCYTVIIEDISIWEDNGDKPDSYLVDVEVSGIKKNLEISTLKASVFTSVDLFNSPKPVCLKDSLLCFTLCEGVNCGFVTTINRLYTCQLANKIDIGIASASKEEDKDFISAKNKLKAVESLAKIGRIKAANSSLNNLKEEVNQLNCDNC